MSDLASMTAGEESRGQTQTETSDGRANLTREASGEQSSSSCWWQRSQLGCPGCRWRAAGAWYDTAEGCPGRSPFMSPLKACRAQRPDGSFRVLATIGYSSRSETRATAGTTAIRTRLAPAGGPSAARGGSGSSAGWPAPEQLRCSACQPVGTLVFRYAITPASVLARSRICRPFATASHAQKLCQSSSEAAVSAAAATLGFTR